MKTGYRPNKTSDVIPSLYSNIAQSSGIRFITDIRLPAEINISDPKLCVLFGNLLENTIDTCQSTHLESPFIKVCNTIVDSDAFSLTADNTCNNPIIYQDGRIMSTKRESIGYGTVSVRAIAEEYNDIANFKQRDNMFYASVLLYLG